MTVAITGASGVVGAAVLRHLVAEGETAVAVVRSRRAAEAVAALGGEPAPGDVLDHGSLVAAFSGCRIVYHVAGVNEMCSGDPDAMYRVNVEGTRTVLRACAAAGVPRMVYTSSAATIGEPAGQVGTEATAHRGYYLSRYERSKHHAEQVARGEATGVEVVTVNPSSVQGPGRTGGTAALILRVLQGRLPFLIDSQVSLVDIDDCARGHLLAAARGVPGERYLLSGFATSVRNAVDIAAADLRREVRVWMIPVPLAGVAAAAVAGAARLRGRRPVVCPEMVRVVAHGHSYDGTLATRALGLEYTPPEEVISRLVAWFVNEGLLAASG